MNKLTEYFKFIAGQLGHMRLNNYCLFSFSLGVQLMILLSSPLSWISVLTFIGTTLGVLCVIAINATKSVNGWLGIISGICFITIGLSAKNYLSIGEQLAYMVTLDLPVLISTSWNKDVASKIKKFTPLKWLEALAFTVIVWALSSYLIQFVGDPRPIYDGLAFSISLTGGIVCFLRYNNQYFWWLASGIAQVALWFVTYKQGGSTPAMMVNSLIYIANDILAFTLSPWYNAKTRQRVIAENKEIERKAKHLM